MSPKWKGYWHGQWFIVQLAVSLWRHCEDYGPRECVDAHVYWREKEAWIKQSVTKGFTNLINLLQLSKKCFSCELLMINHPRPYYSTLLCKHLTQSKHTCWHSKQSLFTQSYRISITLSYHYSATPYLPSLFLCQKKCKAYFVIFSNVNVCETNAITSAFESCISLYHPIVCKFLVLVRHLSPQHDKLHPHSAANLQSMNMFKVLSYQNFRNYVRCGKISQAFVSTWR